MTLNQLLRQNSCVRWVSSFTFVLGLYTSLIVFSLNQSLAPPLNSAPPMAAMFVELTPLLAAPKTQASHLPATLTPKHATNSVIKTKPVLNKTAKPPLIEKAAATLAPIQKPRKAPADTPKQQQTKQAAQQISQLAKTLTAPLQGAASQIPSSQQENWQSTLLGHLERHKRYPRKARRRGQQGVVYVRVKINRHGNLVEHHLTTLSPYDSLNKETLALIQRAQPLPPPPSYLNGDTVEFIIPVAFSLKS